MSGWLNALLLAMMPAVGNFAGGVLAEFVPVSQRTLSFALHTSAGIIFAVVAVELIPTAMSGGTPWMMIVAFVGGGLFFLAVDAGMGIAAKRTGRGAEGIGPWAIFFGVAVDLFSDGVMIGAGSTITVSLGLLLALGQVPADIPEGFATIATFRRQGVSRRTRVLLAAAFAVPVLLGATVGYWVVQGQPEVVKLALLAFTAGILLTVTVEEMIPEAHAGADSRWATLGLIGGFALFAFLSSYLGE